MKKTYKEVILETVDYYSQDPINLRSVNTNGYCMYQTPSGQRCAVGRVLKTIYLQWENAVIEALLSNPESWSIFKEEYQHLTNINFWTDLQSLHDRHDNWDSKGLTEAGKYALKYMLDTYSEQL